MKIIIIGRGAYSKSTFARQLRELYSDAIIYDGGLFPAFRGEPPAHWIVVAQYLEQVPEALRRDADIIFAPARFGAYQFEGRPQKKVGPALLNLWAFIQGLGDAQGLR